MKNIVLTGLPGCGKSTLGALLAAATGLPFADTDHEIEAATGKRIAEIFSTQGESAFRDVETETIRRLAQQSGCIMATGGGAVMRQENASALAASGLIVFIDRSAEKILEDVQTAHRPLLAGGAKTLMALETARRATYLQTAHLVLDNSGTPEAALQQLLAVYAALAAPEFAVIGEPIAHSLSPKLHAAAFAAQGIASCYATAHVPQGTLAAFAAAVPHSALRGFNVTLPHKQAILPLLHEVEPQAALCGAANTVVVRSGRLCGYNTDMEGLNLSLKHAGHTFGAKRVVVLGCGGAARAAALVAGLQKAAQVTIAARSVGKAQALAQHVATATGCTADGIEWSQQTLAAALSGCNLLINATPLGMAGFGHDFEDLTFVEHLPQSALVCDLVYTPPQTALLRQAAQRGLATLNGLGMLVFQALLAEELFFGTTLDKFRLYAQVVPHLPER